MSYTKEEIKEVQNEVEYYIGQKCSKQEAEEILWYVKQGRNLGEIIEAYYSC